MSEQEIAMQITLKAMDQMSIKFTKSDNDSPEIYGQKYAQQICNFYKTIYATVSQKNKDVD